MSNTRYADTPAEASFRQQVEKLAGMVGFGRMAQIVSEEWRERDPVRDGLLCFCPQCETLFVWDTHRIIAIKRLEEKA